MPTEPLQPPFYYPRPIKTGRPYSSQLDELRLNSEVGGILARAAGVSEDTPFGSSALQAWELGEAGFHNKFRLIYDDLTGSFLIQRNSGTAGSPTWVDVFEIDSTGAVSGVSAISDHGALTGLSDDDHPQYAVKAASQNTFTGIVTAEAFYTPGGEVGAGAHSSLSGLGADDHTQYLLVSGTRAMTGNLDMGGNSITSASSLTVSAPSLSLTSSTSDINISATDDVTIEATGATGNIVLSSAGQQIEFLVGPAGDSRLLLGVDGANFPDRVKAEAFYLPGAGNIYNDGSGNTIIDTDGGAYTQITKNTIIGDPGSEAGSITVDGTSHTSSLKVSDIALEDPVQIHLHRHSSVYANVIHASRSAASGAAHTDVSDGDALLHLTASGRRDTSYEVAGRITFAVDGTPGTGFVPGRIDFNVNDGTDSGLLPPLAMSIRSGGHVRMENTLEVENQVTAESFYFKSGWDFTESFVDFDIPTVAVENYWIQNFAPQAYVIKDVMIITKTGSCTASFYVHGDGQRTPGVSVTGLDPISVTSTKSTVTATANRTVNKNDSVVLSVPANSSGTHLRGRLRVSLLR